MNKLRKGAKVKCINADFTSFVVGKIYQLLKDQYTRGEEYYIIDNTGGWLTTRFVLVGCPCGVDKCIANHSAKDQS